MDNIDIILILTVSTVLLVLITFIRRKIRTSDRIICKKCNGHYLLRKGETLEDFEGCICGGELEYANYKPVKKEKKLKSIKSSFNTESRTDKILSITLVVSIILAVSMTVYAIVSPREGEKFTEFYILGPDGEAGNYPTNLTVGQRGSVIVGVVNHEYKNTTYSLVLKLNNRIINQRNITLAHNEKYENTFNFQIRSPREKQKLEFLLYKLPDNTTVYRSLHLWINVIEGPSPNQTMPRR
ncbi:MAG: DUF1616 domain-containing protein [Methanobacteriaceae archaeon]